MTSRLTTAIVTVCLSAQDLQAQAPSLSRQQRELLQALVAAVDDAATQPESADVAWATHVMRASDGSHYVAFQARPAGGFPRRPVALYVRLSTIIRPPAQGRPERSLVREWLAGNRTSPPPIARQGIVIGDMPVMGPTGNLEKRPPTTPEMATLAAMDLERRRARERQAEAERQRLAGLEERTEIVNESLPFEDFDLAAVAAEPAGSLARALTAGPGAYFLYAAWADPSAPANITVIKKQLVLPAATRDELTMGSVIVADRVVPRTVPYPAAEQASHPYSIGLTEITPAEDAVLRNDETLNVIFQVINARPSASGKPDVEVLSRIVRTGDGRTEPIAPLAPLRYTEENVPAEFDLRRGHPLFAAIGIPLLPLGRGEYRLELIVNDRHAGRTIKTDTGFTVTATALSLLKEAPPLAPAFQVDSVLHADALAYLTTALRPPAPSASLQRALEAAAAGRFVQLMAEEPVGKGEEGVRSALSGLARLALGDGSSVVQLQRAVLLGAPMAPTRVLSGAARALQQRDVDAIAGWEEALKAGAPRALVAPLLLDAYLRRSDYRRAAAFVAETKDAPPADAWVRGVTATLIANGRDSDALKILDAHLSKQADDPQAQWLRVRALYALVVKGDATLRSRFDASARAYVEAKGAHSLLVADWLGALAK